MLQQKKNNDIFKLHVINHSLTPAKHASLIACFCTFTWFAIVYYI